MQSDNEVEMPSHYSTYFRAQLMHDLASLNSVPFVPFEIKQDAQYLTFPFTIWITCLLL